MDCPFCNLDVIEKQKIFETENEHVIYNKWAATEGQCLIAPKRHISSIQDLSEFELISLIKTVQKVSKTMNSKLKPDGFNYGFNENKIAGQHLEHLHFHIIPRYNNDNISNNLLPKPQTMEKLSDKELNLFVTKMRQIFEYPSSK